MSEESRNPYAPPEAVVEKPSEVLVVVVASFKWKHFE